MYGYYKRIRIGEMPGTQALGRRRIRPPGRQEANRLSSGRPAARAAAGDDNRDMTSRSRGAIFARTVPDRLSLGNRGRRENRAPTAPAASCAKQVKRTSVVTTGSASSARLSPRDGLTAYIVLSPVTGLFCHRRLAKNSAKFDTSVGAPGPHDFAVRFLRFRPARSNDRAGR
jgi:hypothetical protein